MKLLRELSYNAICREVDSDDMGSCGQTDYQHDDVCLGSLENVIQHMTSLLESDQCTTTIMRNQIVSGIVSDQGKGTVFTIGGDVFEASYILSTIPAGVLQVSSSVFQDPALPSPVQFAIESLDVLKASIVHLHSNLSIPDSYYTIPIDIGVPGETTVDLLNIHSFTGNRIVVLQANHEVSAILESMTESEVIRVLVGGIQKHFKTHVQVNRSLISHWGKNPYTLGAYTKLSSCSAPSDRATLRQPIGGRIVLAGEWLASRNPGTIHGAYQSGLEQATLLIEDGFEQADSECDCESLL